MRPIKFRGKDTQSGNWVEGDLIHGVGPKSGKVYILPRVVNLASVKNCHPLDSVEVDPSTVGQFTGFLDKNGKEIYEGDLITGHTSFELPNDEAEWTKENPATVDYDIRSGSFYPFSYNNRWRCDLENIEIIGNIHENK